MDRRGTKNLWSMNLTLYLFILIKEYLRKNKYKNKNV